MAITRYDPQQSYQWNYDHAPDCVDVEVPPIAGTWNLCGLPVSSPLGIGAGPLLNGRWILYYAKLGFDILTYKTVRSRPWPCYELPNLQPVDVTEFSGQTTNDPLITSDQMLGTWAVSFGMPSTSPAVWRADIETTRSALASEKLLSVSVVATAEPDWAIDDIADDYARCAKWAVESGADAVEVNLSCPNVKTCDGQLYQNPVEAAIVTQRVKSTIGTAPLLAKIGHLTDNEQTIALIEAIVKHVDGIAMVNAISGRIRTSQGADLFSADRRGIAGSAIKNACVQQVQRVAKMLRESDETCQLIGGGGIGDADDVQAFLNAGAASVQIATAAMLDPRLAIRIRASTFQPK